MLKGLSWRSFTHRRASEPQLAPASALHPIPTLLPAPSAQITPRVQPSVVPTPRLAAAAPAAPAALTSNHSGQLRPRGAHSARAFAAALREAAAGEDPAGTDPDRAPAPAEAATAGSARAEQAPEANGHTALAQQAQQERQQNGHQPALPEQQEGQQDAGSLISWRSDAVQLPEQVLLHDSLAASPTGSTDAAAGASQDTAAPLTARTRGR